MGYGTFLEIDIVSNTVKAYWCFTEKGVSRNRILVETVEMNGRTVRVIINAGGV
jgi:hypothetical protein